MCHFAHEPSVRGGSLPAAQPVSELGQNLFDAKPSASRLEHISGKTTVY